jgi:ABC-type amino acid transport substrate-binding protein
MRKTRLWVLLALLGFLVAAMTAAGCGDDDGGGGELGLIQEGTLLVGSDTPYAPFEFGDPPDYKGFDIDLVNEIADRTGLEVQIEDTSFGTIFGDLQQGKFDLVASSTTITPAREERVSFSDPYFSADQSLMIKEGSDIQSVEDLSGRTVGAQEGTTGAEYAENETDAATVRTYPEIPDAFNALQNEQVEGVINDFPISKYAEREYPELSVIEQIPTGESYGFPVQKDNTALLEEVNSALQEMIDDGTYAEIYQKWFEEEPPEEFRAE